MDQKHISFGFKVMRNKLQVVQSITKSTYIPTSIDHEYSAVLYFGIPKKNTEN